MEKIEIVGYRYICLSTETKITVGVPETSTLIEVNASTGEVQYYQFLKGAWRLI